MNKTQEPAKKLHVNNEYQYIYVYVYIQFTSKNIIFTGPYFEYRVGLIEKTSM